MTASNALIRLLQLCDSSYPLGAYSHSWGLETWTQREQLRNAADVQKAIATLLRLSIAPKDGVAVRLGYQCAAENDSEKFRLLNVSLSATNWSPEIQVASLSMGERLKVLAQKLDWLDETISHPVHHSAVFGWISARLAIELSDAVTAYLCSSVCSHTAACVKLVPLGHTDGQKIIAGLALTIESESATICQMQNPCIRGFAPLHEQASFEHERLYSRLFQS
jgi:urease accessory protein